VGVVTDLLNAEDEQSVVGRPCLLFGGGTRGNFLGIGEILILTFGFLVGVVGKGAISAHEVP
jgi:hypothetical protein